MEIVNLQEPRLTALSSPKPIKWTTALTLRDWMSISVPNVLKTGIGASNV